MNYELAKQLKDAGFPQNNTGFSSYYLEGDPERVGRYEAEPLASSIKRPTLSELIAATPRLENLAKFKHLASGYWTADAYACEECGWEKTYIERGSTPEEAVARLWLALNKKT